ncbi:hypothetical protein BKA82DRAFT_4333266 [Pisolithus tinctorius]|nr:hypothetical protein BKA82DRAFT_4333266 [Pisolithus tinctorius]
MDDVSGNISKQWNKHFVIYMSNASLPQEMLDQEFHVHFVSSSPHASPMELMYAVKESICKHAAETGMIAWDCHDEEEVFLIPNGLFHTGDNPMQAEICSQGGLNCNYFCRTCHVGGTKDYKESDSRYCTLFEPRSLRTPTETANMIKNQFSIAMLPGAAEKVKTSVSTTGMGKRLCKCGMGSTPMQEPDVKMELEVELATLLDGQTLDDMINPLLGMTGVNIHLDTPTEILHTILLGVKAKLLEIFHSHLNSIEREALNAPSLNADYICNYKGSLIGKHFKSLAQVMPFVIYDLVPQSIIDGWTIIGELVVFLWHTQIDNLEVYLVSSINVILLR